MRQLLGISVAVLTASTASAQDAWHFRWQKGQTLVYRIKHVTSVVEIVENTKSATQSSLDVVNRWTVGDVNNDGVAQLSMTLTAMRNEQKRANGETLLFDSADPGKSTPELREQMSKYIGQTLAVLRIDGMGRVHEVKQGSKSAYEAELPFVIAFPKARPAAKQKWERAYKIVLDPPFGAGDKFDAAQRFECVKIEAGKAFLTLKTELRTMPDNARERLPLLQKDVQGELVFDVERGRLISARLHIDKTIENHQGKGSSYHFKSEIIRELMD